MLSEEKIDEYTANKNKKLIQQINKWVEVSQARLYVPFAGYFQEAHPSDADVKRYNRKNTPSSVCRQLGKTNKDLCFWEPAPGEILDMLQFTLKPSEQSNGKLLPPLLEDMARVDELMEMEMLFPPLQTMEGVVKYFEWAKMALVPVDKPKTQIPDMRLQPLIVHVVEQDIDFKETYREWYVDLRTFAVTETRPEILDDEANKSLPPTATARVRYLRIRARAGSIRRVMRKGDQWDDFNIGFQGRYFRDPDIYNESFWSAFANALPHSPPDWREHAAWYPAETLEQVSTQRSEEKMQAVYYTIITVVVLACVLARLDDIV